MFFNKATKVAQQTVSSQYGINMAETSKLLASQIKGLQDFAATEIPKAIENQQALNASLEKLVQSARALIK